MCKRPFEIHRRVMPFFYSVLFPITPLYSCISYPHILPFFIPQSLLTYSTSTSPRNPHTFLLHCLPFGSHITSHVQVAVFSFGCHRFENCFHLLSTNIKRTRFLTMSIPAVLSDLIHHLPCGPLSSLRTHMCVITYILTL
jgi:hypothetical protein